MERGIRRWSAITAAILGLTLIASAPAMAGGRAAFGFSVGAGFRHGHHFRGHFGHHHGFEHGHVGHHFKFKHRGFGHWGPRPQWHWNGRDWVLVPGDGR